MTINKAIEALQEALEQHGDLEIGSVQDEMEGQIFVGNILKVIVDFDNRAILDFSYPEIGE